jgi:hypothetical protein
LVLAFGNTSVLNALHHGVEEPVLVFLALYLVQHRLFVIEVVPKDPVWTDGGLLDVDVSTAHRLAHTARVDEAKRLALLLLADRGVARVTGEPRPLGEVFVDAVVLGSVHLAECFRDEGVAHHLVLDVIHLGRGVIERGLEVHDVRREP